MRKCILIISIFLSCLTVPLVQVIAQNSNQAEKPSAIDNTMTERERQIEEIVRDDREKRLKQKKEVFIERNIDVNSITPRQIEELLDSNELTVDDVENMFPEEMLMRLRVSVLSGADKEWGLFMPALMGEALYELRYYVGEIPSGKITPKLTEAVKDFQRSLGNESTGEMLFGEFNELMNRYGKLHPQDISLPSYRFFNSAKHGIGTGYVSLEGTWVFKDGTPQADPIQTSTIELNKNTMSGLETMASIHYTGDLMVGEMLMVDTVNWKITKWDTQEIVAENDAPQIVSYTLTVDLKGEKAYMFRRPKGNEIFEETFGKVEIEASILELVDGFQVSSDFNKKRQEEARTLYNPKYKNVLERLSQTGRQPLPSASEDNLVGGTLAEQKTASNNKTSTEGANTIFIGFPKKKVSEGGLDRVVEDLSRKKAVNFQCIIIKSEDKYYWASRENVEMVKIESGAFITFLAVNGSGYVRVIKPELKEAASLMDKTEETFDYTEHLVTGLRSVNYWGEKEL